MTPENYKLYEVYTAAHEDTFFDQSRYYNLQTPRPYNSHVILAISRSKHATCVFNPDYFPLTPAYVIISAYQGAAFAYASGAINWYVYLGILLTLDSTFYGCGVERFQEQPGVFASTRINVGELNRPQNDSYFIQDTELTEKLSNYFY